MSAKLSLLTCLAMIAFAANSVFCRLALRDSFNDPLSFTLLRLFSGAVLLSLFIIRKPDAGILKVSRRTLTAPIFLFSYALFFSLAYVKIGAGTGALILFASVQVTMLVAAFLNKQRMNSKQWFGVLLAVFGLIYLLSPGLDMPPLEAALLMAVSGISWGFYSLMGQGESNPTHATLRNFIFTTPFVVAFALIFPFQLNEQGVLWAISSGSLTSGLGYVLWYKALRDLATTTAAIAQLSVPAIAAFGGVIFLGESVSVRLIIASVLIFAGIALKVLGAGGARY